MEKSLIGKTIKTVKAFKKGLVCIDFQYEIGKEYYIPKEKVKIYECGFHASRNCDISETITSYPDISINEYCLVEIDVVDEDENIVVGNRIKLLKKLSLEECIEYDKSGGWCCKYATNLKYKLLQKVIKRDSIREHCRGLKYKDFINKLQDAIIEKGNPAYMVYFAEEFRRADHYRIQKKIAKIPNIDPKYHFEIYSRGFPKTSLEILENVIFKSNDYKALKKLVYYGSDADKVLRTLLDGNYRKEDIINFVEERYKSICWKELIEHAKKWPISYILDLAYLTYKKNLYEQLKILKDMIINHPDVDGNILRKLAYISSSREEIEFLLDKIIEMDKTGKYIAKFGAQLIESDKVDVDKIFKVLPKKEFGWFYLVDMLYEATHYIINDINEDAKREIVAKGEKYILKCDDIIALIYFAMYFLWERYNTNKEKIKKLMLDLHNKVDIEKIIQKITQHEEVFEEIIILNILDAYAEERYNLEDGTGVGYEVLENMKDFDYYKDVVNFLLRAP